MEFAFYMPSTVNEALQTLANEEGPLKILAGGTDLMLDIQNKKFQPRGIVDLTRVKELKNIILQKDTVHIGSMVTFCDLANSALIKERVFMLAEAASVVGSPQIRNQGTIGGNIVNASPAADIVPSLVALDAVVTVVGRGGQKDLPITDVLAGAGKTNLSLDEIVTEVKFFVPSEQTKSTFVKFGRRNALAIARMSLALMVNMEGTVIQDAKVALGAVAPNPFQAKELEQILIGKEVNGEFEEVIGASSTVVSEKLGKRPSAAWKNQAIRGLMREALQKLQLL